MSLCNLEYTLLLDYKNTLTFKNLRENLPMENFRQKGLSRDKSNFVPIVGVKAITP